MLYLDTSALVKRYVEESGSRDVRALILNQPLISTCSVTRVEAAAAFSRSIRLGSLTDAAARQGHRVFVRDWKSYVRIRVTESLLERADSLAWMYKLRGYDAVHLSAALEWQDRIGEVILLATFDRDLWTAAGEAGIERFPADL